MLLSKHFIYLIYLCFLLLSMPIQADERIEQSKIYINQAQKFLANKQYELAIEAFQNANVIYTDLQNLIMIGSLYSRLNRCKEGLDAWDKTIQFCQSCEDLDMLLQKKAKLQEKCTVTLNFSSEPPGVMILQDGLKLGLTPFKKLFLIDHIMLEAQKPGFEPQFLQLDLSQNEKFQNIHLNLKALNAQDIHAPTGKKNKTPTMILAISSVVSLSASFYFFYDAFSILKSPTRGYSADELSGLDQKAQALKYKQREKEANSDQVYAWVFLGTGALLVTSSILTFKF
jgi:tetratricopeptide (TPR) repeat protein